MGKVRMTSVENHKTEMDISSAHQHRLKTGMENEGVYTDQCVKFCPSCRNCYEIVRTETIKYGKRYYTYNMMFLRDFPSYGKEKKTCPRCLGQEVIKIVQQ